MNLYSKEGLLLLVQVDHLNGELLGSIIEYLYKAGAFNVQCIQTITKKNRPGIIFLIDTSQNNLEKVEATIINEIGSTGWHLLNTEHRHTAVEVISREVVVKVNSIEFPFEIQGKKMKDGKANIRPEHSSCTMLKDKIEKISKKNIPLKEIYDKVGRVLDEEINTLLF
ncbi:nickel insertion protein [Anaerosphaera multitolerans]|uniref:DUF111 family protein n=1 Tax=Anaerosphaera multitolerans TaxID=2487351 RepID=A0A437S8T0_9FIRM|nr:nickel insertion protein [Anaerosphaera multitolerans]RVU55503.1 DUF111 family protein [Anaerosphaera multitolerans]